MKYVTSTHCEAIDKYALVLRIDGSLAKYGEEGIANVRFAKARRYITLDIQIPEAIWKPLGNAETMLYLTTHVKDAISISVDRLVKDKFTVNKTRLMAEIDAAVNEYLSDQNSKITLTLTTQL